jgi:hypothetical protein
MMMQQSILVGYVLNDFLEVFHLYNQQNMVVQLHLINFDGSDTVVASK